MADVAERIATLSTEEREKLKKDLRNALAQMPSERRQRSLYGIARRVSPEFAVELATPPAVAEAYQLPQKPVSQVTGQGFPVITEEMGPITIADVHAMVEKLRREREGKKEEAAPWYAKAFGWAAENIPGVKPVTEALGTVYEKTALPISAAAQMGMQKLLPGEQGAEQIYNLLGEETVRQLTGAGGTWARLEALEKTRPEHFKTEKAISHIVFDPITWVGLGAPGLALKGLTSLAAKGMTWAKPLATAAEFATRADILAGKALAAPIVLPAKGIAKIAKPVLKPMKEIVEQAFKPDSFRGLAEFLDDIPVVNRLSRLINPSATLQDDVGKLIVAREATLFSGQSLKNTLMPYVQRYGDPIVLFGVDEEGIAKLVKPKKPETITALGDVLEHPDWFNLNPTQKAYIKAMHQLGDVVKEQLVREGVDIRELPFREGAHYVHRVVKGRPLPEGGEVLARQGLGRVGAKQSFQKTRFYEFMIDGIKNGVRYGRDANEYLSTYIDGAMKLIADKRLADAVKPLGRTYKEYFAAAHPELLEKTVAQAKRLAAAQRMERMLEIMQRGFVPAEQSLKSLAKYFPEFIAKLRESLQEVSQTVAKSVDEISQDLADILSKKVQAGEAIPDEVLRVVGKPKEVPKVKPPIEAVPEVKPIEAVPEAPLAPAIPTEQAEAMANLSADIPPETLAKMSHKEFIAELEKQGKPFLTDDIATVNKLANWRKGIDLQDIFRFRANLVYGAIKNGVTVDGFLLIEDKAVTQEVIGKFLEKQKEKEIQAAVKMGRSEVVARKAIDEGYAKFAEDAVFPKYKQLYPAELGKEAKLVGVKFNAWNKELLAYLSDGTSVAVVNADKLAFVLKYLPDAKMVFAAQNPTTRLITFIVQGEAKGLLMPFLVKDIPSVIQAKATRVIPEAVAKAIPKAEAVIPEIAKPEFTLPAREELPQSLKALPEAQLRQMYQQMGGKAEKALAPERGFRRVAATEKQTYTRKLKSGEEKTYTRNVPVTRGQQLYKGAQAIRKTEWDAFKPLKTEYSRLMKAYKESPPAGWARIAQPAFQGRMFPLGIANRINQYYGDMGAKWIGQMSSVSGMARTLTATLDLSAPFIQGLPTAFTNPFLWAKLTLRQFKYLRNPLAHEEFMVQHAQSAMDAGKHGVFLGTFEYFTAMKPIKELISKLPKGKTLAKGFETTYGRAAAAFNAFGNEARILMWEQMTRRIPQEKWGDLARWLNHLTGVSDMAILGIRPTQRQIETAFGWFAPRYTRAMMAFMADILKGGWTTQEALKFWTSFLAGGTLFYVGVATALGQEPNFDLRSSRAFTIRVGDRYFGIPGFIPAAIRFSANLAAQISDDPKDLLDPTNPDNAFVRWYWSRTAPLTKWGFETIGTKVLYDKQQDFLGQPFESPGDYARYAVSQAVPFSVQPFLQKEKEITPLSVAAEAMGLRTFPVGTREKLDELQEQYARQDYPQFFASQDWEAFKGQNPDLVSELEENHPDVAILKGQYQTERKPRLRAESKIVTDYIEAGERARETWFNELNQAQRAYDAGRMTPQEFRQAYKLAGAELRGAYEAREQDPQYASVRQILKDWEAKGNMPPIKAARNEYLAHILVADDLTDEYGQFDYKERDRRKAEFRAKWGDDIYRRVLAWLDKGEGVPPMVKAYLQTQELLKPYWDLQEQVLKLFPGDTAQQYTEWQRLGQVNSALARELLARRPDVALASKLLREAKEKWKKEHPQEAWLIQFWY